MFIDLNVPFSPSGFNASAQQSGKQKNKQKQKAGAGSTSNTPAPTLSQADLEALNARLNTLVHLGYTTVALNYTIEGKIDPVTHINPLLAVPPRTDLIILRRLTIILDESSEKGFGLSTQHATHLSSYDIIALRPTTANTFSLACLTHTQPSPTTAHIISIDAASASPQLPFRLKLSLVRTAVRNGGVFEISYAGALASDDSARRNWWAGAREIVRATKGKGLLLTGGGQGIAELRAPLDAINLATILDIDQNTARNAMSTDVKSLIIRASTRQTYRAVLSAPILINVTTNSEPATEVPADPPVDNSGVIPTQPTPTTLTKRVRDGEDPLPETAEPGEEAPSSHRPAKRPKGRGANKQPEGTSKK